MSTGTLSTTRWAGRDPRSGIKEPTSDYSENRQTATHTVAQVWPYAEWQARAPQLGDMDPRYPGLVLATRRAVRFQGNLARVTLTYSALGAPSGSGGGLPDEELTESTTMQTVDVTTHPDFSDNSKFPTAQKITETINGKERFVAFTSDSDLVGVTGYGVPNKVVTHVKYFTSRPDSLPVPQRRIPPGYTNAATFGHETLPARSDNPFAVEWPSNGTSPGEDDCYWLRTACDIFRSGKFWVRRQVFQHSGAKPWSAVLYP